MKLVLFGATGMIGSRILKEALQRDHQVTVVIRDLTRFHLQDLKLTTLVGNVLDPVQVAKAITDHDAVLNAVGPGADVIVGSAHILLEVLPRTGVKRLVVVGGSGGLEVAPGLLFVDAPNFPQEYRVQALANCEALRVYQCNKNLEWTIVTPPIWITPGNRTGKFRTGADQLLIDSNGESRISAEDYTVAFLDEVEKPRHIRQRFTVAY
jgi:putative NADH-flavin reductase